MFCFFLTLGYIPDSWICWLSEALLLDINSFGGLEGHNWGSDGTCYTNDPSQGFWCKQGAFQQAPWSSRGGTNRRCRNMGGKENRNSPEWGTASLPLALHKGQRPNQPTNQPTRCPLKKMKSKGWPRTLGQSAMNTQEEETKKLWPFQHVCVGGAQRWHWVAWERDGGGLHMTLHLHHKHWVAYNCV